MATVIPYNRELEFEYGASQRLSPLVRRVIAPNPSAFTFHGTGTYIIGPSSGSVAIVDPGPDLPEHVDAVLAAVSGETVSHILVTHTHLDHSPATVAVKAATGAPSYAFGPHGRGGDGEQVEEGADFDFIPDHRVADGETVAGEGWSVEGIHTPGHTSNHMCFALKEENALFPGDHVMGWSTTIVSPPDGHMRAYMASLEKLTRRSEEIYYPTHGAPITEPLPYVSALLTHRHEREEQILACLADGIGHIPDMVAKMYADVDPGLHRAAGRSVLSHLIHMVETGRTVCQGKPGPDTNFNLAG